MRVFKAYGIALTGVDGVLVEVEADLGSDTKKFTIVGLPDISVNESRDRVCSAIGNCGFDWPDRKLTVGLSPASVRKRGSGLDLAIAVAVMGLVRAIPPDSCARTAVLGELGLDGQVRPVRGVLPAILAARAAGMERVVVPHGNLQEAELVPGICVASVGNLRALAALLTGQPIDDPAPLRRETEPAGLELDLCDVVGQPMAKRALEIAAAGGHHLLMVGPPGAGKTMLATRMPGIMPLLADEAALEVTAIHSVVGVLLETPGLIRRPPFSAPHHTASVAALIGGGAGIPRPGAISLAHRGVLFLDEAPEFNRVALDALREPMESGEVVLARSEATVRYPSRFQLILAANRCPCAAIRDSDCRCPSLVRRRYLSKISGPMLDRIDLRVDLTPADRAALLAGERGESTAIVRDRVAEATERAARRWAEVGWKRNADAPGSALRSTFAPEPDVLTLLGKQLDRAQLSARGIDKVLRVAWTIADLDGVDRPGLDQLYQAMTLKSIQLAA